MEISSVTHIDPDELVDFQADLFITTLGFESRGTSIARRLENETFRKIALSRTDHSRDFAFTENKVYYQEHGYEIIPVESRVPDMESILREMPSGRINILIDYTSMSQRWYYEFFRWFSDNPREYQEVHLRLAYTMAGYSDLVTSRKVKKVKEFLKNESPARQKKKKALVLGLGHEKHICERIYHMVNPDLLFLYYADPPVDKKFVEKVFVNNHTLIDATPIRNLVSYPIRNGQNIYQSLIDTILPLREQYEVQLVPQGPKIFSVAAMLVHLEYPDTIISYPTFKRPPTVDRQPLGEPVVLDVFFEEGE